MYPMINAVVSIFYINKLVSQLVMKPNINFMLHAVGNSNCILKQQQKYRNSWIIYTEIINEYKTCKIHEKCAWYFYKCHFLEKEKK